MIIIGSQVKSILTNLVGTVIKIKEHENGLVSAIVQTSTGVFLVNVENLIELNRPDLDS